METTELVIQALKQAGKPLKGAEIAQLGGLDKKEVDKAIKKLKLEGRIHSPKNCYYEPK
ncbi:MAG: MarR family transcriptional regulator [Lentimicrobiaceae bacterium]|nr:MarR family transcriptional regulator [Lentimicrobiaceae bacterium]